MEESAAPLMEESAAPLMEESAAPLTEECAAPLTELNLVSEPETIIGHSAFESAEQSTVTLEEFDTPIFAEEPDTSEPAMTVEMLVAMDTATLVTLLTEACRHAELRTQRNQIMELRYVLNDRFELEKRRARAEFLASGGLEEDYSPEPDPLFLLFMDTISKYQQRRQQEREQRDREQAEGLRKKEEILNELLKAVEQEENGIQLEPNSIKGLQQRWNESGLVPAEQRQELWKRFNALLDRFYANLRINRELKELDMQKNLAFKIGLCEQAESLMLMSDIGKALSTLAGMHELWKSTGPVVREQREEVWQRFKLASDRLHDRRRERQAEMDAVLAENLRLKTEIISTLTETLLKGLPSTPVAWNEMGQKVDKLQADWRATGPVAHEKQDELWSNFRSLLSSFFEQRGQFFKERKQEWGQLRMEAERICTTAEELAQSTDWKSATEALMTLQEDWKKCNVLPHKIKEKFWTRFKSAKDQFFTRKKVHYKDQDARREETKALLESITAEVEAFVASGEHKSDLEALQVFQRRWSAASPLPLRMREAIHNRYRNALQAHYDKLHASARASNQSRYTHGPGDTRSGAKRQNPSSRDNQQGDSTARNDRNRLQSKLNELENDIRLWENNINFFAMSKNAGVLRAEVQSKIDQAKKDAQRLRAQIAQHQSARSEPTNQAKNEPTN
jgi:ABC-type transporter MlaC component